MNTKKLNENQYEVIIYDWIDLHDDYVCGHVKRQPDADSESDLVYWMFYPIGDNKPLSCGNMKNIFEFISKLN